MVDYSFPNGIVASLVEEKSKTGPEQAGLSLCVFLSLALLRREVARGESKTRDEKTSGRAEQEEEGPGDPRCYMAERDRHDTTHPRKG